MSERIVIDPEVCGGRPIVAGTRMRVIDVLDALASGAGMFAPASPMPRARLITATPPPPYKSIPTGGADPAISIRPSP